MDCNQHQFTRRTSASEIMDHSVLQIQYVSDVTFYIDRSQRQ